MTELSFAKQFLTALEARPARLSSDHVVDPKSYPAQPAFILPRMSQPKRKRGADTPPADTTAPTPATAAAAAAAAASAPSGPVATVTLKPTRPTATTPAYTLPAPLPVATTSMHDLKAAYATYLASTTATAPSGAQAPLRTDKIKVLYAKKPVGDTKTIKDVLGGVAAGSTGAGGDGGPLAVEFTIMILGGGSGGGATPSAGTPAVSTPARAASPPVAAPAVASPPAEAPAAAPASSAEEATQTEIEMGEAPPAGGEGPEDAAGILATEAFWADLKGFLVGRLRDESEGERLAGVFREATGAGSK